LSKLLAIDPAVIRRLRELPKNERTECLLALCDLLDGFGQPHVHTGLGMRKLAGNLFECRGTAICGLYFKIEAPSFLFHSSAITTRSGPSCAGVITARNFDFTRNRSPYLLATPQLGLPAKTSPQAL
jgi:hypothetical protein